MASYWTIAPQTDGPADADWLRRTSERNRSRSRIAVHAVMLTIVLSVAVGVILLTAGATVVYADLLHEAFEGLRWPAPVEMLHDISVYIVHELIEDVTFA